MSIKFKILLFCFIINFIPNLYANSKKIHRINKLLKTIKLPKGFHISLYALAKGARSMDLASNGTLYIGTGGFSNPESVVYKINDYNHDNYAESVKVIARNLDNPNGIAYHKNSLFVAERFRIIRFDKVDKARRVLNKYKVIYSNFPHEYSHSWKVLRIGPDGKLYVPVGAPCNICNTDAKKSTRGKFSRIFRMNLDGSNKIVVARGVRNTVGFDWHPQSKKLWFTDNGRDNLGDNIPPDELNKVSYLNQHFGYPFCHGKSISDPIYGRKIKCNSSSFTKPHQELGPHVASLGMRFYTGKSFPRKYKNQIFIAEHGSWNRSKKIGYRISLVRINHRKQAISYTSFARGWLRKNGTRWGRPVDVEIMADGSMLISDDFMGAIYRIYYRN